MNPSNTTRPISPFPPCGVRRECWAAQSADYLGDKCRKWAVVGEVVCVLGYSLWWATGVRLGGHVVGGVRGQVPCLARTWTVCSARGPDLPHVGRLFRMWAWLPRLGIAG